MTRSTHTIRKARIDIPLNVDDMWLYLFVDADCHHWDPWWSTLFATLASIHADPGGWQHNPEQDIYVNFPSLTESDKTAIVELLRTAPPQEVVGHRTLRRAVRMTADQIPRLRLVFFSDVRPVDERAIR